jgi:hypothetical protein
MTKNIWNGTNAYKYAPVRCGNVASILELDENLRQEYKVFRHAPSVRLLIYAYPCFLTILLRTHALSQLNDPQQIISYRTLFLCPYNYDGLYLRQLLSRKLNIVVYPAQHHPRTLADVPI